MLEGASAVEDHLNLRIIKLHGGDPWPLLMPFLITQNGYLNLHFG